MGIQDREYYRDDQGPVGFQVRGRSMVINLIIVNVLIYLFCVFNSDPSTKRSWATELLALNPTILDQPWLWWKFITYGFAHDPNNAWHIVGNMFGLFFFGRDIEALYGKAELLRIYLVTVVLGGVVWAVRSSFGPGAPSLVGASGAVTAIIVLFCLKYPKRTILLNLFIPVPAWVLGVLVVLGDIGGAASMTKQAIAFDVHLTGAAFAALYFFLGWNLGALGPKRFSFSKVLKPRPKLRVHRPDEHDPDLQQQYEELDRRGDEVLSKWHREGADSLSEEEQKILEDYSRRMKQKLR